MEQDSNSSPGSFEVKINGQRTVFNVESATLTRSISNNQKRMDIAGTSTDSSKRLIITIGDTPATGDDVRVKDYVVHLFNEDDPATSQDESVDNEDGYLTYSEKVNNGWITDIYAQRGLIKITACNPSTKKVSGTFNVQANSLTGGQSISYTEGKFNNIAYTVTN